MSARWVSWASWVVLSASCVAACGADDDKKRPRVQPPEHGGEGGVRAGEPSAGKGGADVTDAAGHGGVPRDDGGAAGVPTAGAGGAPSEEPTEGGAGGVGGAPEPPLTGLFVA